MYQNDGAHHVLTRVIHCGVSVILTPRGKQEERKKSTVEGKSVASGREKENEQELQ